jgi:translation initiation factor 2 beta subunit (eIF-2beta)/eIF-5
MIKLASLLEIDVQPSERARLKNFLYRGSRDQINLYTDHPENKEYQVGKSFDDPSGIFEDDGQIEKIQQSLIGREFQTLDDLGKMCSRLRQRGFTQSDIEEFLRTYIL